MNEMVNASAEGTSRIRFNNREAGSITNIQYFQTLQSWWFVSTESKYQERVSSENNDGDRIIERGMQVKIEVCEVKGTSIKKEVKNFIFTSVPTEAYNRWYMFEKGNQTWKRNIA